MLNVKYIIHQLKLTKLYIKHFVFDKMMSFRSFKPRIPIDMQHQTIEARKHLPTHK